VIVRDEKIYDAKAVVLAAHRKQFGTDLASGDFRGSRQVIADPLRQLGFTVIEKRPVDGLGGMDHAREYTWDLLPGEMTKRTELPDRYGGSGCQDGVSPSRKTPNVFLFSDPKSGLRHGYVDEWGPDGTFLYTGRGQRGDQEFVSGNRAIRDHVQNGRALRLFEGAGGVVRPPHGRRPSPPQRRRTGHPPPCARHLDVRESARETRPCSQSTMIRKDVRVQPTK
jgi:hypothetical protein